MFVAQRGPTALPARAAPASVSSLCRTSPMQRIDFDEQDSRAFAPVISLTEAQIERGRAARHRQKRLEALRGA